MPKISFYLNNSIVETEVDPFLTVLQFLREQRGLTGVKDVCCEGDCGACTIAVGEWEGDRVVYRAVNSCLMPAAKMNRRHIVTVEGLAANEELHPIQQAMLEFHAVQCGYCTPGVIMSLFCLLLENPTPSGNDVKFALDGTLCRCTGYAAILKAALSVSGNPQMRPGYFAEIAEELRNIHTASTISTEENSGTAYHCPASLEELFRLMDSFSREQDYILLAGGTDVMLDLPTEKPKHLVDLSGMAELRGIEIRKDRLIVGANVNLAELLQDDAVRTRLPALYDCLSQMCSTQIRNVATLAGNICTASPIADSICVLMVYEADVITISHGGERRIPIADFISGYRRTALQEKEIVKGIEIPFPAGLSSFEKTGKRRALDIASVNSAFHLRMEGKRISQVRLVYGGVAPIVLPARKTCEFLMGKNINDEVIQKAGAIAESEFSPISDVRGSDEFRRLLIRNHLIKHFLKLNLI